LRLVALGAGHPMPSERFYRRQQGQWRELGSYPSGAEPVPSAFPQREAPSPVYVDPVLRAAPAVSSPIQAEAVSVVWTVVGLRRDARRPNEPFPRLAPDARTRALEQIARVTVQPTVLVDEGASLVALWRLARPVDPGQARTLLLQLRQRTGGDSRRVDLRDAVIALPGGWAQDVYPGQRVTAEVWADPPVDVGALEAALR
jgi:hypothetical protein